MISTSSLPSPAMRNSFSENCRRTHRNARLEWAKGYQKTLNYVNPTEPRTSRRLALISGDLTYRIGLRCASRALCRWRGETVLTWVRLTQGMPFTIMTPTYAVGLQQFISAHGVGR